MAWLTSILFLSPVSLPFSLCGTSAAAEHQRCSRAKKKNNVSGPVRPITGAVNNRLWSAPAGLACLLFCVLPALPSGQTSVIWRTERQIYFKDWRALGIPFLSVGVKG
jgi:hypothetical protein